MVARLQGFPDTWEFSGGKTAAYRQVGNAFRPPVAGRWARRSPPHCQAITHTPEHPPARIASFVMNTEWRGSIHPVPGLATGTNLAPYGALALAAFRGDEARASAVIEATIKDVTLRGEGLGITVAE
jgi:hypothetical protein